MRDASGGAPPTVGIVAGEASGDTLAAALIGAVRARDPRIRFVGVAGPKMQAQGCETWVPLETLSVGGFVEVLAHLPEILRVRRMVSRRFRREHIDLFVGVDAPDFNLGLEQTLRRHGIRTLAALLILREQVIKPVLAGVYRPERGRPPKNLHPLDVHYQKLQREMLATFQTLKIAA